MPTRRQFLRTAFLAVGAGVGLYTWRVEPHWLEVVRRTMRVVGLPQSLRGARLVHLSDLHIGRQVDDDYLLDVFAKVRALEPEVVVYTGDFVSFDADVAKHARRMLAQLPLGSRGTFGIPGNHDYGPGWNNGQGAAIVAAACREAGVTVLRNEVSAVEGLQIVGLDDLWAGRFDPQQALAAMDPAAPSILLTHNPDTADDARLAGYRGWMLAGHTHGGQCKPPFLPPPMLPVQNRHYTCGEFPLPGERTMYISRGVGHTLQVRFNVRPEVTVFRLETA